MGSALLARFRPPVPINLVLDYTPDQTVVAYSFALCLAATLVAGLVPALRATRPEVLPALRSETPFGSKPGRLGGSLVTAQMALSLFVLVAMSLFLQSLAGAQRLDPGFRKQNLLLARYDLSLLAYPEEDGDTHPGRRCRARCQVQDALRRPDPLPVPSAVPIL